MPTGDSYGRRKSISSFKHLSRIGPTESELARFLYPMADRDVVYIFDDFVGGGNQEQAADWNESTWVVGNSANGTAFGPPSTQVISGICEGTTGAYDQDTISMATSLVWMGDHRCGMEVMLQVDDHDNQSWELGFNDALADVKEPILNDIDTPSYENGGADVALLGQQTGATFKKIAFVTDGSTSGMNATKTDLGTRVMTNAQYMTMRVQLDSNTSFAYLFDNAGTLTESAIHDTLAKSIEGGILLQSRILWEANTTSAVVVDIDYWGIWQDRVA